MRCWTVLPLLLAVGCSGHSTLTQKTPPQKPPVTASPANTAAPSAQPSLTAAQTDDPGLPSTIGSGPLTAAKTQALLQFFEDKVAQAYAANDADSLYRYLAGPMLTGNRGTIKLLAQRHTANVFRITVGTVKLDTVDATRVVADITPDETLDYYVDTATKKVLNNGAPGPSHPSLTVFLDLNPSNHTWYWTGQKAQ